MLDPTLRNRERDRDKAAGDDRAKRKYGFAKGEGDIGN